MYLTFNNKQFEIDLVKTDFAHVWQDWLFKNDDIVNANYNEDDLLRFKNSYDQKAEKLRYLIDRVNEIVVQQGVNEEYLYTPIGSKIDMQLLSDTHEQWADITKKTFEHDLLIQEVKEIYNSINTVLNQEGADYTQINNFVHDIEFEFKFFYMHNVSFEREAIGRSYEIKTHDTSFVKEFMCLPYYDIGRPQFEKFQVSGKVVHPEISNYIALTNSVHLTSYPQQEVVPLEYTSAASEIGAPAYGNHLPVCRASTNSPYAFGEFILTSIDKNSENILRIAKG